MHNKLLGNQISVFFVLFGTFSTFSPVCYEKGVKKAEKDNCNQQTLCDAPVQWSKYTTNATSGQTNFK